jgi:hypothetical protein
MNLLKIAEGFGKQCERLLRSIALDQRLTEEERKFVRYYCSELLEKTAQHPGGRSYRHNTQGGKMQTPTLTTTLSELNRLFGRYYEEADKQPPHSQEAENAWIEYETYARRYNEQRGLNVTLEPRRGCS